MSKFERFPEMLANDAGETRIVNDQAELELALAEGFKTAPGESAAPSADQSAEVATLRTNLEEADKLIAKLDEAGARATAERDEARQALDAANAEIEDLKAKLAAPPAADPLDHDGDGKKGGSAPDPEREALKKDLNDLKVPFARNATTETLRRLLDEATR